MPDIQTAEPPHRTSGPQPTEHTVRLRDGTDLFYRAWRPSGPTDKALIFFHRGHEHSGRFCDVVEALALDDVAIFAWDARGHGRSPGRRGHADSFQTLVRDADAFIWAISRECSIPIENMVVLGHSIGAVIAATWVHDYAPPIRGLALVTPAFRVKLYVPFAILLCRLLLRIKGKQRATIRSYVKPGMLTHDREQARRYAEDPLITRQIAVNLLLDLHDTSTRLLADAGAFDVPTLLIGAGADWVVKLGPQKKFFDGLSSRIKQMNVISGAYHDVLHEPDRRPVLDGLRRFIVESLERTEPAPPADGSSPEAYTRREYERLSRELPWHSPRGIFFSGQKVAMKTLCRLSRGVRLGWATGFDSGRSLDYVYENKARGFTPLGRLIDRVYLNSSGWKGIRQRKTLLRRALGRTIEKVHASGRAVELLDIAAGPGRYVLEAIKAMSHVPIRAFLRDREEGNLEQGRNLAERMKLSNVQYEQGDAFDADSIAGIRPRPTVAVVSGLYELFEDNRLILRSLSGLAAALEDGGYLIYTNQPWHPQIEMIARVLVNREGQPWVMRRRTQAEMDALVRSVGFEKIGMEIDDHGLFTVSVARLRRAS